jgi:hypothetical protein
MRHIHSLLIAVVLSISAVFTGTAQAQHGNMLPSAPFGLGNPLAFNVTSWSNTDANTPVFNQNVYQSGAPGGLYAGQINFNYDTWTGVVAPGYANSGAVALGAGLSGGFTIAPGVSVVPGFTLAWAQIVTPATTIAGQNSWSAPNGTGFPDTSGTTSPVYPFLSLAGGGPVTTPFQDFPTRYPSAGAQNWLAEDALVALNNTTDTMRIVDSFLWGFNITAGGAVTASSPSFWQAPTSTFVTTETNAFSAAGINGVSGTTWTIQNNLAQFPVFVPEPATMGLLLVSGVGLLSRRPKKRAA